MKNKFTTIFLSIFVLLILLISIPLTTSLLQKRNSSEASLTKIYQSYPYPPPQTAIPEITEVVTQVAINTLEPLPTPFPPIEWSDPFACENNPISASAWKDIFSNPSADLNALEMYSRQIAFLSPFTGNLSPKDITSILNSSSSASTEKGRKGLIVLLLNIAAGQINRATELQIHNIPNVNTVDDLLTQLEESLSKKENDPVYEAVFELTEDGAGIVKPVCAQLFISEAGNNIRLSKSTSRGWETEQLQPSLETLTSRSKILGRSVASPNGKIVAFVSGGRDTGGPIFLLSLKTREWINLIEKMNSSNPGNEPLDVDASWDIIGWFPNSKRIFIGPSDLRSVYVVDITDYAFQSIALNTGGFGGSDITSLSSTGKGFVYAGNGDAQQQVLYHYDLSSNSTSTLFELSSKNEVIYYPRFSPDGKTVVFVVQKGHPTNGVTYSIYSYSMKTQTSNILIEGNLGLSVPTWSPDGKYIAFIKKEPDEPDFVIPGKRPDREQGNLWIVNLEKQARQLTFIQGSVRNPEWASDGKSLAFTTHNGEVGIVSLNNVGKLWKIKDNSPIFPLFTRANFVP